MLVAPSILSADFGNLNQEIAEVENFAHWIHVDVMDGHFVPNLTFGAPVISCLNSKKPLDCHLMISNPEKFIPDFIKAGAASISTHVELGEESVLSCQKTCKEAGVLYGLAINPETSIEKVFPFLDQIDYLLVMSVHPGFGGQSFIPEVLEKVKMVKEKTPNLFVEMDGGINSETVKLAKEAGVDLVVAGSFIFGAKDRVSQIQLLDV